MTVTRIEKDPQLFGSNFRPAFGTETNFEDSPSSQVDSTATSQRNLAETSSNFVEPSVPARGRMLEQIEKASDPVSGRAPERKDLSSEKIELRLDFTVRAAAVRHGDRKEEPDSPLDIHTSLIGKSLKSPGSQQPKTPI